MKSIYVILVLALSLLAVSAYSFWEGDVGSNCQYQSEGTYVDCDEQQGSWRDL